MYSNRWMDKGNMVHIYNGILALKKKQTTTIYSNMNGSRGYYTLWNKSDRGRQTSYDTTYMWNLKNITNNLHTKYQQTHRHRKQTYGTKGEKEGRNKVWVCV